MTVSDEVATFAIKVICNGNDNEFGKMNMTFGESLKKKIYLNYWTKVKGKFIFM